MCWPSLPVCTENVIRIDWLRESPGTMHQQRAAAEGIPLKGSFVWNAMDMALGIVHADFKTQKRTRKPSAQWFREAARRNAVV